MGFRWAAGSWAAKSSPRRNNKKRIVSKSWCCFIVIFNFYNFAGEKYICVMFRDTVTWVNLLSADLITSIFPQKLAGFTFPTSRKSQPLAHQRGQPLGSYLFPACAMPHWIYESTHIHAPLDMGELMSPRIHDYVYIFAHVGFGDFVAVKKWQVLILVAWHGLVERRVQRPWGSISAITELLSLWQGPRPFLFPCLVCQTYKCLVRASFIPLWLGSWVTGCVGLVWAHSQLWVGRWPRLWLWGRQVHRREWEGERCTCQAFLNQGGKTWNLKEYINS